MRVIACALLALAACSNPAADKAGACLPLPVAMRDHLTADPDATALYWLETVARSNYDADRASYARLIRYDVATRRSEVMLDHAAPPIHFIDGRLVTLLTGDSYRAVLVGRDGRIQELTPDYLDVLVVEVIDSHSLAVLADGSGARAVYTLDLREPRVKHLIDADRLLSTSGGRVFVRDGDDGIIIDPQTGKRGSFAVQDKAVPDADGAVFVDRERVLVHSMSSGETKTVIASPGDWKLALQADGVLARTPVRTNRSYAFRLAAGNVTPLATLVGGTAILGVAMIGSQTWALVGHNTANYVGDFQDINAETDVCRLPPSGEVTFPTRSVPARYLGAGERLLGTITHVTHGASAQILELTGVPTTVYVVFDKVFAARDLDLMRSRTRAIAKLVRSTLDDREIRIKVEFADQRVGIVRWTRQTLRDHTVVGMGDALLTDPGEYDLAIGELVVEKKDDKIRCSGTVENLRPQRAESVDLKCSGNRQHVIHVGALAANERRSFAQTFDVSDLGEAAYLEAFVGGVQADWRDLAAEQKAEAVFELATEVYAATRLSLVSHDMAKEISLELRADPSFLTHDQDEQDAAIMRAYDKYQALRGIYHVDAKVPMRLHAEVELSSVELSYDGTRLSRDD